MTNTRKSGILLHITSLPNQFGIGDMGSSAYRFIDFLYASKQRLWQILPLGPTDFYASPYTPYSAFAGNHYLVSPKQLIEEGLLLEQDIQSTQPDQCIWKEDLLTKSHERFMQTDSAALQRDYETFCSSNSFWLQDYALFMSLKAHFSNAPWIEWPNDIAKRCPKAVAYWLEKLALQIQQHQFNQFIFYRQWCELKTYAQKKGITIIGDIPIFVAYNSADVWANPHLFLLDDNKYPLAVAGVPPDYFSETGQLWGNPLYNWQAHSAEEYNWWIMRFTTLLKFVDIIRIDHFRGFESYWQIPFGEKTAVNGQWQPGPGSEFFKIVQNELGYLPFIAEDLGFIDNKVIELRDTWNLPGMRVLQFAFENLQPNSHSPHEHTKDSVVYTGTHDNDTTVGWYQNANSKIQKYTRQYIGTDGKNIAWDFIRLALASPAYLAVIPLQDILSLDSTARMNIPGTTAGNWRWRYCETSLKEQIVNRLSELTVLYGRYDIQ